MTTTGAKAFLDTNVLLRAFHAQMELHTEARAILEQFWDDDVEIWISRQVIREYLVQITHPQTFAQPLVLSEELVQVEKILSIFRVADETQAVTLQLITLLNEHPTQGKQVHDANIVATMLVNGIDTLATMNVADMKRFADKIRLIPLQANSA